MVGRVSGCLDHRDGQDADPGRDRRATGCRRPGRRDSDSRPGRCRPPRPIEVDRRLVAGGNHCRRPWTGMDNERRACRASPRAPPEWSAWAWVRKRWRIAPGSIPSAARTASIAGRIASGSRIEQHPFAIAGIDQEGVAVEGIGQVEAAAAAHDEMQSFLQAHYCFAPRSLPPVAAGGSKTPIEPQLYQAGPCTQALTLTSIGRRTARSSAS